MGLALQMPVRAEAVESEPPTNRLRAHGRHFVQRYYSSLQVAAKDIHAAIRSIEQRLAVGAVGAPGMR